MQQQQPAQPPPPVRRSPPPSPPSPPPPPYRTHLEHFKWKGKHNAIAMTNPSSPRTVMEVIIGLGVLVLLAALYLGYIRCKRCRLLHRRVHACRAPAAVPPVEAPVPLQVRRAEGAARRDGAARRAGIAHVAHAA